MPAPLHQASEERAVDHRTRAIAREHMDHCFPLQTSWLVKLTRVLPESPVVRLLPHEIPPLPASQGR